MMARKVVAAPGLVQFLMAFSVVAASLTIVACAGPQGEDGAGAADAGGSNGESAETVPVAVGIDVLLRDSLHLVRGKRVGLITNHTGVSSYGDRAAAPRSTIDLLHESPDLELVALYGPEHGIRGDVDAGERVESGRDAATGLPIYSLYTTERKPPTESLEGLDVLLFDIQDIGARYYTYVWTMALAMEAAGEAGLPFLVLDRPNPIGGHLVQGNVLDPAYATFVGLYPVPMRHGLTAGELALMLVGEFGVDVDLTVVPMDGWTRSMWYDETGLPWIAPSPNMPSLASATHYPGTCLFEGVNVSVGRGTDAAFEHIGAPWLDAEEIAARLNGRGMEGVRFETVAFTPTNAADGKYEGEEVAGIRFVATDRDAYDPTRAAVAALIEIVRTHPDEVEWYVSHFDRLAGTADVREGIIAGAPLEEIVESWEAQVRDFVRRSEAYRLYD